MSLETGTMKLIRLKNEANAEQARKSALTEALLGKKKDAQSTADRVGFVRGYFVDTGRWSVYEDYRKVAHRLIKENPANGTFKRLGADLFTELRLNDTGKAALSVALEKMCNESEHKGNIVAWLKFVTNDSLDDIKAAI